MNKETIYPLSKVDPKDTRIEFSCRCMRPVLVYLEEKYGKEEMEKFIAGTGMNLHYLKDRNNWISYDYYCRVLKQLVEYTRDPMVAFAVGKETTKNGCYGVLERLFCKLGTLQSTYTLVANYSDRMTKVDTFSVSDIHKNGCTVKVTMFPGYEQDKNNCLSLQGIFSSIPYALGLPYADVQEAECAASGAAACVYKVTWTNRPTVIFGLTGALAGLIVLLAAQQLGWTLLNPATGIMMPILGYCLGRLIDCKYLVKETTRKNREGNEDLVKSIETIEKLNIDLQKKVEIRTRELSKSNQDLNKALADLKKSQKELIHSEKMASVGYLAAGMAHELNNPVGAIRNYIQDVIEDTAEDDPRSKALKLAEKATSRCGRIVKDLLTFARESKNLEKINIHKMIEDIIGVLKTELDARGIEISMSASEDLPEVEGDLMQIQQVITNLITNAFQAIDKDGKIDIRIFREGKYLFIEIADTGGGISRENKNRIFDPFFTTKAPGKGQGLGLSISYNIIKRFSGDITVENIEGKGAVFTVKLPANE